MGSTAVRIGAGGWGGGAETERCLCSRWQEVRQRESKDGEQKLERENTAGGRSEQRGTDGGSGQTVRCFGFQEDFCPCLWSVRVGAKFNWMSLELQGRTEAAVTVLPHRTGFSVSDEFRVGNRVNSRPCGSIKGHACDPRPPTPDPPVPNKELKCCKRLCLIVPRWFPG